MGIFRKIAKRLIGRTGDSPSPQRPPVRSAPRDESNNSLANIECTAQELKERMEAGEEVIVIDVRESHEIQSSGIIPGAKHFPLRELPARWEELKEANEVVCYCAAGARSYNAAMLLRERGIFNATSMDGGFATWRAIGGPSEKWSG